VPKTFAFDNVYGVDCLQRSIYDESAFPIVESVMEGYNGTVFAYGQTGCGKTFTMTGVPSDSELRGIIPNSFAHIFEEIREQSQSKTYLVRCSFMEIYNEQLRDLLDYKADKKLSLKENKDHGVYVHGLSLHAVTNIQDIERLMETGTKHRFTRETQMNETSSRSHSLFVVQVEQSEETEGRQIIRAGKLNLVDLAGSERQKKTGTTGESFKEAVQINLSLNALGNVISALVDGTATHVPYRDSKLTRLLQDSLGGNTRTLMIAVVSPADYNYEESLSTLRYASRAKFIQNKPTVNEDPKDALLRSYAEEINRLKQLLAQREGGEPLIIERIVEKHVDHYIEVPATHGPNSDPRTLQRDDAPESKLGRPQKAKADGREEVLVEQKAGRRAKGEAPIESKSREGSEVYAKARRERSEAHDESKSQEGSEVNTKAGHQAHAESKARERSEFNIEPKAGKRKTPNVAADKSEASVESKARKQERSEALPDARGFRDQNEQKPPVDEGLPDEPKAARRPHKTKGQAEVSSKATDGVRTESTRKVRLESEDGEARSSEQTTDPSSEVSNGKGLDRPHKEQSEVKSATQTELTTGPTSRTIQQLPDDSEEEQPQKPKKQGRHAKKLSRSVLVEEDLDRLGETSKTEAKKEPDIARYRNKHRQLRPTGKSIEMSKQSSNTVEDDDYSSVNSPTSESPSKPSQAAKQTNGNRPVSKPSQRHREALLSESQPRASSYVREDQTTPENSDVEEEPVDERDRIEHFVVQIQKQLITGDQKIEQADRERLKAQKDFQKQLSKRKQTILETTLRQEEELLVGNKAYSSLQEEVEDQRRLILKLRMKCKASLAEVDDLTKEHGVERQTLLGAIRKHEHEIDFFQKLTDYMLAPGELTAIRNKAKFKEDENCWTIPPFLVQHKRTLFPKLPKPQGKEVVENDLRSRQIVFADRKSRKEELKFDEDLRSAKFEDWRGLDKSYNEDFTRAPGIFEAELRPITSKAGSRPKHSRPSKTMILNPIDPQAIMRRVGAVEVRRRLDPITTVLGVFK
jgi:kinesin family protein 3/17